MQYAAMLLIFAQILVVVACAAVYLRMRARADLDNQKVSDWSMKIESALSMSQGASAKVEIIETSHYKVLAAKLEEQALEICAYKIEVQQLKAEVVTLRTTIASQKRYTLKEEREESRRLQPELAAGKTVEAETPRTLEEAIAAGMARPMDYSPKPVQSNHKFGTIPKEYSA